jgi:hypothetical protein
MYKKEINNAYAKGYTNHAILVNTLNK